MICNAELGPNYISVNVSVLAVAFRWQILKKSNVAWNCLYSENCNQNSIARREN